MTTHDNLIRKQTLEEVLKFVKMYSQNDDVSETGLIPIMDWLEQKLKAME